MLRIHGIKSQVSPEGGGKLVKDSPQAPSQGMA